MIQKVVAFLSIVLAGSTFASESVPDSIDRSGFFNSEVELQEAFENGTLKPELSNETQEQKIARFRRYRQIINQIVEEQKEPSQKALDELRICAESMRKYSTGVRDDLEEGWRDENDWVSDDLAELARLIYCDVARIKPYDEN